MKRIYVWLVSMSIGPGTGDLWWLLCPGCVYYNDVRGKSKGEKRYSWPYVVAKNKPTWWRLMFCQHYHKFMCWETYHCPEFRKRKGKE